MKKKSFITSVVILLLVIPFLANGQIQTFDLSQYKLPELGRHQLDFSLHSNNQYQRVYDEYLQIPVTYNDVTTKHLYSSNNINTRYLSYYNRMNYQGSHDLYLDLGGGYNKNKDGMTKKSQSLNAQLFGHSINRFYFQNQFFLETDLYIDRISTSHHLNKQKNLPTQDIRELTKTRLIDVNIPVLAGKGRIDQVQDARMAVYILEALNKKGKLKHQPTHEEILEFARTISKIEDELFFDFRNEKIYELTMLDSFLQAHDLVKEEDMTYYTSINDYWQYAHNPIRESGRRISAGIIPRFYHYYLFAEIENQGSLNEETSKTYQTEVKALLRYDCERPINLQWQSSLNTELAFGKIFYKENLVTDNTTEKFDPLELSARVNYQLGWYPNSRSYYELSLNGYLSRFLQTQDEFESANDYASWGDETYYQISTAFNGHYYISPQLRLSGLLNMRYANESRPDPDFNLLNGSFLYLTERDWTFILNIALTYYIF
jgi:hypothetical protein